MSAPANRPDHFSNPLQILHTDLQRRDLADANQQERRARQQQLNENRVGAFQHVISFARGLLDTTKEPRGATLFAELARGLLAFNQTLSEADQEYPRYRILERLKRATQSGVLALDTAACLLLVPSEEDVEGLARTLERIQNTRPYDVWSMWLTYILDQLMNSHRPPVKDSVPPDTTREEWRKADLAFGCILFSDDAFRVLQASVDEAACKIDDALECCGHPVPNRPPARVRDMIARFDPRALHWYGSVSSPLPLLQPPQSIEAITEPKPFRRQLDEVWTAANCLQIALDKWAGWFVELKEKGDAHPAVALNYAELARRAVKVLLTYQPNVKPFDTANEEALLASLPPIPLFWVGGSDDGVNGRHSSPSIERTVRWQGDRSFLDRYYYPPESLQDKAVKLRASAAELIDLLKSFPVAALPSRRPDSQPSPLARTPDAATDARPTLEEKRDCLREAPVEVEIATPFSPPARAGSVLTFLPGAFVYRGQRSPLSGKALEVLRVLNEAQAKTLTLAALRDKVWTESVTGEETIRSAVWVARKALRQAIKAVGIDGPNDPLPVVDRGTNRTAWRLDLP